MKGLDECPKCNSTEVRMFDETDIDSRCNKTINMKMIQFLFWRVGK
jgi:hypothetical protein